MKRTDQAVCWLLLLILVFSVLMTGCRRSEVLEQKIYTENQQIDKKNETQIKDNDEENINDDQEITSKKETEEAQTERHQTDSQPVNGSGESGTAPKLKYGESAPANGTAEGSGSGETQGTDSAGTGVQETAVPQETGEPEELQTVDDENGDEIEITDTYTKVAAVGAAAAFVEMLGGSGKLKASSESFTGSETARSLFTDLGEVKTLWTGDGKSGIGDEELIQLISLLTADEGGKGMCLYDTGTLNSGQIQEMTEAGIDTYSIELAQNSSAAYKEQVMAIGTALGDGAEQKAQDYCGWYDRVMNKARSGALSENKYTLYISDWDDTASWQAADIGNTGLAVAPSKSNAKLLDEYLSAAGVSNRGEEIPEVGQPHYWYVNPLLGDGVYAVDLYGTAAEILRESRQNKLTSIYSDNIYLDASAGIFPAVITKDASVAQALSADKSSDRGLWTDYGKVTVESQQGYGFSIGNALMQSTIHGDYGIYPLPRGILGSWASGTPESVLSSMWASWKFGGGISESDVKSEMESFYQMFCGTVPGDLDDLLNG